MHIRQFGFILALVVTAFAAAPASAASAKWSVTLAASPGTSVSAGSPVVLTATASRNVGPTPYAIDILDTTRPKAAVQVCTAGDGLICQIAISSTGTHAYVAKIESDVGTGVQAGSATVKVTWSAAHGWSVTLTASPGTSVATGTGVTLTATANQSVSPTPYVIDIYNQTDGIQICSAETGTTCVSGPQSLSSAGSISYMAKVEMPDGTSVQATSIAVLVSWGGAPPAWSVTLSASPGISVNTGTGVTLTAHASRTVDATGFVVDMYDTASSTPICTISSGTDCVSPSQSYNTQTTHTYVARVEQSGGSNVQATSSQVQVTWNSAPPPWSVSLTPSPSASVNTGTDVTFTAHASRAVDTTGFVIHIYDTTGGVQGNIIFACSTGTDCVSPAQNFSTPSTRTYIAKVEKSDGTHVQATSSQVQVTWSVPAWSVTLSSAPGTTVNTTFSVKLTAHASRALDGTGFVIDIYDTTASPIKVICTLNTGTDCVSPSQSYGTATTRTYIAKVEQSGGSNVQTSSSTLTVNWVDWYFMQPQSTPANGQVALGQTATISFTATQPVDNTGFVIHIFDVAAPSTPIFTCTTGSTCSTTTPAYNTNTTHTYGASIEHADGTNQQASSNIVTIVWGTGHAGARGTLWRRSL